jgi:lipid-A-disaccharide synthase
MTKVCIVAGEASGDLIASALIKAVKDAGFAIEIEGIAGPKMQAAGAKSLFPMAALSVRGYVEALSALPRILKIRRQLIAHCRSLRPDLYIGVDAPDFNLGVEKRLKRAGIPTVHFVSPAVWAWRPERLQQMRAAADHTLLIFPMEAALYQTAGIPATYVGHPFAHSLPLRNQKAARERLKLQADTRYCVLMPGSRVGEINALAETFILAAKALHARQPEVQFLVPLVTRETLTLFEATLSRLDAWGLPMRILFGHGQDALEAADCALIASGTATLEATLMACPHVVAYKVPWLTAWIMRRKAKLKRGQTPVVALPNILAGRPIVPEFLQAAATPLALATALEQLLTDPITASAQREALAALRHDLTRDTPRLLVEALRPFLAHSE